MLARLAGGVQEVGPLASVPGPGLHQPKCPTRRLADRRLRTLHPDRLRAGRLVQCERCEDARMPAFWAVITTARLGDGQDVATAELETLGYSGGGWISADAGDERRELLAENM
jgi:hypothetical protein